MDKKTPYGFNNVHVELITSYRVRTCWEEQKYILVVPAFCLDISKLFITAH